MSKSVITPVNPDDPDYSFEQFVVLDNNSSESVFLDN